MKLKLSDYTVEYHHTKGRSPCVVFFGGFNSNMRGNKALALENFCCTRGQAFLRFDYSGHGESGGDFADGCITRWLGDSLAVIDAVAGGDVVLVGSSMGAWISLLVALQRKKRTLGLLLLASAVDMTKHYHPRVKGLSKEVDAQGREYFSLPNSYDKQQPYRIYTKLLNDGKAHYLLDSPIALQVPVRLIHGMQDDVVAWQRSEQLLRALDSNDVTLQLIKSGDHRLSEYRDLEVLFGELVGLLELCRAV